MKKGKVISVGSRTWFRPIVSVIAIIMSVSFSEIIADNAGNGHLTTPLGDEIWNYSQWLSAEDAPVVTGKVTPYGKYRSADGSSWFVSTVSNHKDVIKAIWTTTGLGTYELFANGEKVGKEILKPGYTHFEKTRHSYTYDITDMISLTRNYKNTLAAEVTPGWWADMIITPDGHQGMVGNKPAFRAVLELTYIDGSKEYFGTNTTDWKAGTAGPVKHAAIFDGEEYDARELPGYSYVERLYTPEINNEFSGEIIPVNGGMVYLREDLAMKPIQAYLWGGN